MLARGAAMVAVGASGGWRADTEVERGLGLMGGVGEAETTPGLGTIKLKQASEQEVGYAARAPGRKCGGF